MYRCVSLGVRVTTEVGLYVWYSVYTAVHTEGRYVGTRDSPEDPQGATQPGATVPNIGGRATSYPALHNYSPVHGTKVMIFLCKLIV